MKLAGGIFLLFFFGCLTGFGQIQKGTILLGGTVRFEKNQLPDNRFPNRQNTEERAKVFGIGPQAALFVAPNVAVGFSTTYEHTNYRRLNAYDNSFYTEQSQTLSLGPFVRYYQFIDANFALLGQAAVFYSHDYNQRDLYQLTAALAPGLVYFATPKIGLELNAGGLTYAYYASNKNSDNRTFNARTVNLRFMNGAQISINFYLGR